MLLSLFVIVASILIVSSKYTIFHASEFGGHFNPFTNGKDIGGLPRILDILKLPRDRIFIYTGSFIHEPYSTDKLRLHIELEILHKMSVNVLVLGDNEYKLINANFVWFIKEAVDVYNSPIVSTNIPNIPNVHSDVIMEELVILSYTSKSVQDYPAVASYTVEDIIVALDAKTNDYAELRKYVFIAAGCTGIKEATKIAEETEHIHIVISGCSKQENATEGTEPIQYPLEILNKYGRKVLIAHIPGSTKYLGKLEFEPSGLGGIKDLRATRIYVNSSVSMDTSINNLLKELDALELGNTTVYLNGKCERRECNLGNMISDAFIQYKSDMFKGAHWTDTPIALMPAGNIKASINASATKGLIMAEHLKQVLPEPQKLVTVDILGSKLHKTVVTTLNNDEEHTGRFLQVSGLHIRFDHRKRIGKRMIALMCRCSKCEIPALSDIKMKRKYRVITTENMVKGAFGQHIFGNSSTVVVNEEITDFVAVSKYIKQIRTVNVRSEERIRILRKLSSGESFKVRKNFLFATIIIYSLLV